MAVPHFRPSAPMYKQVADHLAQRIISGELPPGSSLPSENELIAQLGVSRQTVRAAMAEVRAMGLVASSRGKRSAVRAPVPSASAVINRNVARRGAAFTTDLDHWREVEPPAVTRTDAALTIDRLLTDDTGAFAAHRTVIPGDITEEVPALADKPDRTPPPALYAALTAAGQHLTWRETVTARAPHPDERDRLRLAEYATPILLIAHRVALGDSGRPLLEEELSVSADRARFSYDITAAKPEEA